MFSNRKIKIHRWAFTLQNEALKSLADNQKELFTAIIEARNNLDNTYSDIVSDGGLDPRTKYEAERFKRPWVGLTDDEILDIVGRAGAGYPAVVPPYTRGLFKKIEDKLREKNG